MALEIEIDCNSDIITVFHDNREITVIEVKNPHKFVNFFSEIFNRLLDGKNQFTIISVTKIDEDNKKTMEEW